MYLKKTPALSLITITSKMQLYQGAWRLETSHCYGSGICYLAHSFVLVSSLYNE